MNIKIIHAPTKEEPFLVLYKPKYLPSAPLSPDDSDNALSKAIELFPQIRCVHGKKEIEYGLLHRLDTATDGLMVIATTQECYDFLCEEQKAGNFIKYYKAECDLLPENAKILGGFPAELPQISDFQITTVSYFRPYGEGRKEVRPVTEKSGKAAISKLGSKKLYTTQISIINKKENTVFTECRITEGYRHQVRCHLAWAGYPVKGDLLYNSSFKNSSVEQSILKFSATKLSFEYPKGLQHTFTI